MTDLKTAILATVLNLYAGDGHTLTPETVVRMDTIATAIADAAPGVVDAAAVLTVWHSETRLARDVHAGGLSRWGSDHGRARCLGQIHRNGWMTRSEWSALAGVGLDATRRCAAMTLRILRGVYGRCRAGWPAAYSAYASGRCEFNRYAARARKAKRLADQMRRVMR